MEGYNCSIQNYICDEYSICREERQYALYLNNLLRKYRHPDDRKDESIRQIFDACGIPKKADVHHVFYEVTFMRDFLERTRRLSCLSAENEKQVKQSLLKKPPKSETYRIKDNEHSFNAKLLTSLMGKQGMLPKDLREINYGHNPIPETDGLDKRKLRAMMNAKPDLAVCYRENGQDYLLFLECKFESSEKPYYIEEDTKIPITQTKVQYRIAAFLCENGFLGGNYQVAEAMKKDRQSVKVKFVRKPGEREKEISIGTLIDLERKIFQ